MTLAAALLYDKSAEEDVVHDVFVLFVRSCGQLRVRESLKGYLATSVANNVRNRNKVRLRDRDVGLDQAAPVVSQLHRPDFSVIFDERCERVAAAMSELPYEQREVLLW
jgi:DNA-directed RNA polymerase specialized sigma24 family protein